MENRKLLGSLPLGQDSSVPALLQNDGLRETQNDGYVIKGTINGVVGFISTERT